MGELIRAMEVPINLFLHMMLGCLFFAFLVAGDPYPDETDFISIDCGAPEDYIDPYTNTHHSSDAQFLSTGLSRNTSEPNYDDQRLSDCRIFPDGVRNCYTLRPEQREDTHYLIRAWFTHDGTGKNSSSSFDLYVGANLWSSVYVNKDDYKLVVKDVVYKSSTDYLHVCLVNTGLGTPFIMALELRYINGSIYKSQSGAMVLSEREDIGSYGKANQLIGDRDALGRKWTAGIDTATRLVTTDFPTDNLSGDDYDVPQRVMSTALTPLNASEPLTRFFDDGHFNAKFYVYMHFCEVLNLKENEVREFDILLNDIPWVDSVVPGYLKRSTVTKPDPVSGGESGGLWVSLVRTKRSTLPPILNAIEVYLEMGIQQTANVDSMVNISLAYGVKRNWQGDPCLPTSLSWYGLNCSYRNPESPEIISLDLSSSGLTGEIPPALASLGSLQHLDLSNNSLTGPVPEFLSQLHDLKTLDLSNNKLTGSVPRSLMKPSLSLRTEGNSNLCLGDTCFTQRKEKPEKKKKKKKMMKSIVIVISAVLAVAFVTSTAVLSIVKWRKREANATGRQVKAKNRRFSYSEVSRFTNNFERVIGKGGFGTVYLGSLEDGTEVAVKMLTRTSPQGSEQFWTEAELLTMIHHKNLACLIGYCDQGSNTALVYEYMENGNLEEYLSDKSRAALTWLQRLQIALHAAQALEYLHNGCKPPIIHRDIKTANILLNTKLQAKVADFGLSRIFPLGEGTHVSTAVVGTLGYLDPLYYVTNRLTEKSDVYSFGVVLLELITGKPAIVKGEENTHIVQWVMPMLETGDTSNIADPRLQGEYDNSSLWKALETAMAACGPSNPNQRPTMNQVLAELKNCLEICTGSAVKSEEMASTKVTMSSDFEEQYIESSINRPQAR